MNTVAANTSNIGTVANVSSDVTTVAGVSSDVSTVAGVSSSVTTVANNVAGVNSFADRYRVGSSNPSSSLDAGDLFFNTTDNALRYYDGSGWQGITGFTNGGTMTGDLTVDGTATIDGGSSANTVLTLDSSTANTYLKISDSNSTNGTFIGATTNDLNFYPNNVLSAKFAAGGNISFYEDTGTTAKLFWDASAEALGIGTTSPDANSQLHIKNTGANAKITLETDESNDCYINFSGATAEASIGYEPTSNAIVFTNSADGLTSNERLRIGSSGDTEVSGKLIIDNQSPVLEFQPDGNYTPKIDFSDGGEFTYATAVNTFYWKVGGNATRLSLDSSGNLVAAGNVTAYSDERLKDNIETLDGSKVYEMRGVSFTKDGEAGSGVIAQELQKVAPELVHEDGEYLSVAYGNVVGYLIEAIKDLKAEVEELKNASAD